MTGQKKPGNRPVPFNTGSLASQITLKTGSSKTANPLPPSFSKRALNDAKMVAAMKAYLDMSIPSWMIADVFKEKPGQVLHLLVRVPLSKL